MANDNKSKAELYREERKQRIAKANKKNAKATAAGKKAARFFKRAIAIVLAAAIVLGVGYYLLDNAGVKDRLVTAAKIGDDKISAAQFYYYYYLSYQQALSLNQNYSQFGMTYIDENQSPDAQDYPFASDDGGSMTWADALVEQANNRAQSTIANYREALNAGMSLDDDEKSTIDATIDQFKTSASNYGFSLNAYLKSLFGFNEKTLRKQLEIEQLASKFQTGKQEEFLDAVTDADLDAEIKENPNSYGTIDARIYAFTYTTLNKEDGQTDEELAEAQKAANDKILAEAKKVMAGVKDEATFKTAVAAYEDKLAADAAKADAEAAAAKAKDEAAPADTAAPAEEAAPAEDAAPAEEEEKDTTLYENVSYSTLSNSVEAAGADWAFEAARKANDVKLIEGEKGAYIVCVTSPKDLTAHSVTVRYALFAYNDDVQPAASTEEHDATRDDANLAYENWKKAGDLSEDSFSKFVTANSDDSSTSADGGKLDVRTGDSLDEAFKSWATDPARKPGDTAVVESERFGYFVLYFSSDNKDDLDWKATAKDTIADKNYSAFYEKLLADDGSYTVKDVKRVESGVSKDFCKTMKRNIALNNNRSASY